MGRDVFIAKYLDETVGLLIGAFSQVHGTTHKAAEEHWAADGRFMIGQMKRAKELLGRIFDDLQPKTNGVHREEIKGAK